MAFPKSWKKAGTVQSWTIHETLMPLARRSNFGQIRAGAPRLISIIGPSRHSSIFPATSRRRCPSSAGRDAFPRRPIFRKAFDGRFGKASPPDSDRSQRAVHVGKNDENPVEPRNRKDRLHVVLDSDQNEFASVSIDVLHPFDQSGQS